jgi:hypothetical protein
MKALLYTLLVTQLAFSDVLGNTSGQKNVKRNNHGGSKKHKNERTTAEEDEYGYLTHNSIRSLSSHNSDQCQLNIECKGKFIFLKIAPSEQILTKAYY